MRKAIRRGLMAAMAVGTVVAMTGCSVADQTPTGDALYRDGERNFVEYATAMHSVIMAVHAGDWVVDTYGASPIECDTEAGGSGYTFSWVRLLAQDDIDVDAVVASATAAFEAVDADADTATYGEGDAQEVNVIGTGGSVGRGVVTIRPARGQIEVSATPGCFAGSAADLSDMVFAGLVYDTAWQRFPAFEGPDWQPRFYFPEDGSPVYRESDGTPVQPQPTPAEFPVAPYGDSE